MTLSDSPPSDSPHDNQQGAYTLPYLQLFVSCVIFFTKQVIRSKFQNGCQFILTEWD